VLFAYDDDVCGAEVSCQFTEAESNMQDLVAEYQQYQDATYVSFLPLSVASG
jgi:hypothetical protein